MLTPQTDNAQPERIGGLTVWANAQKDVSYAARYVSGGVQQFVHIAGPDAPTSFAYNLPKDITPKTGPGGSIQLFGSSNRLVGFVPAPWAKDANGEEVSSHFEISG